MSPKLLTISRRARFSLVPPLVELSTARRTRACVIIGRASRVFSPRHPTGWDTAIARRGRVGSVSCPAAALAPDWRARFDTPGEHAIVGHASHREERVAAGHRAWVGTALTTRAVRVFAEPRGVVLAMSLIALLAISLVVLAFLALSSSEPMIAHNLLAAAAARAIAEAGVEHAIWALNPGPEPGRLHYDPEAGPLPDTGAAPFDGSRAITLSVDGTPRGAFRVTLTPWMRPVTETVDPWRVRVHSVGWIPTDPVDSPRDTRTRAHQRITATLMRIRNIAGDARCALCVRGPAEMEGPFAVDARGADGDPACGAVSRRARPGSFAAGPTHTHGGAIVYGSTQPASGPHRSNRVSTRPGDVGGPHDIMEPGGPDDAPFRDAFDAFAFTGYELDALRTLARNNDTYYRGSVTFDSVHRLPSGVVFADTVDGQDATASTPDGALARVTVLDGAASGEGNTYDGWLIVNGSLAIRGSVQMNGLVYAVDDILYTPTGQGRIEGQVIATHRQTRAATRITASGIPGHAVIRMNCAFVKNGGSGTGFVPQTWSVVPGSYTERPASP
jgi:hypothetical protein